MKNINRLIHKAKQEEKELKKMLKVQTILVVAVALISVLVSFKAMKISIEYEKIKQEKENLETLVEIQQIKINEGGK